MVPIAPPAHSEAHFDCHCLPDLFQDHFSLHEATMPHWCWPSVAWDLTDVERTFGGRDLVAGGVFYHALTIFCCGDTRTLRYCRFKITPISHVLFLPPVLFFFVTCVYSLRAVAVLTWVAAWGWASPFQREGDGCVCVSTNAFQCGQCKRVAKRVGTGHF